MNFLYNFKVGDQEYRISGGVSSGNSVGSIGCHTSALSALGFISCSSCQKLNTSPTGTKIWENITKAQQYNSWGQPIIVENADEFIVGTYLQQNREKILDYIFELVVPQVSSQAGCILFSDRTNYHIPEPVPGKSPWQHFLHGGPSPFAKWLHKNRQRFGPVYGSPIFNNPRHRSAADFSLVQVYMWITKQADYTIMSDIGDIPCPRDPERTLEKVCGTGVAGMDATAIRHHATFCKYL